VWVTYRRHGREVLLEVHGELDICTAPQLRRGLACLIHEQGNLSIVLDLKGLTFMDASGVSVLMVCYRGRQSG
jgi:anti-anti-sigma factor